MSTEYNDRVTLAEGQRVVMWLFWIICLFWHPIITLLFLPSVLAKHRGHKHPVLVFFLNLVFFLTPAVLLVLMYSLEKPKRRRRVVRKTKAKTEVITI